MIGIMIQLLFSSKFFSPTVFLFCSLSFFLLSCGSDDVANDVIITTIPQPIVTVAPSPNTIIKDSTVVSEPVVTPTVVPVSPSESTTTDNNSVNSENEKKEDVVHSIVDLHKRFGEPPSASFGRLSVPALDIDAPIGATVVTDGSMGNPIGPSDVVYYDFQGDWINFGGDIGERTNAIFSGHVDYVANVEWADIRYEGVGVFYNVSLLSPGDVINIRIGERTYVYGVVWRRMVPAESDEWQSILRKETGLDMITLITCTGEFDPKTLEYNERTVVRAHRM
jgi:sortase (surface protein transpeptidase)